MGNWVIVAVTIVLTALAAWAYATAQRLHRLHIRTDAALVRLQAALELRSAVAATLAPELDHVAVAAEAQLLECGHFAERAEAERALHAALAQRFPERPPQLVEADARVKLAFRFYNEAVADTRALRLRPAVRILRLGGTAGLPEFFELSEPATH